MLNGPDVLKHLNSAYRRLLAEDRLLLELDANERSMTHKLAEHLQVELPEWDVDCEYNRDGVDPKRLAGLIVEARTDDDQGRTVFPDIVVHHRNTTDNLAVIEAKKSTTATSDDTLKLRISSRSSAIATRSVSSSRSVTTPAVRTRSRTSRRSTREPHR